MTMDRRQSLKLMGAAAGLTVTGGTLVPTTTAAVVKRTRTPVFGIQTPDKQIFEFFLADLLRRPSDTRLWRKLAKLSKRSPTRIEDLLTEQEWEWLGVGTLFTMDENSIEVWLAGDEPRVNALRKFLSLPEAMYADVACDGIVRNWQVKAFRTKWWPATCQATFVLPTGIKEFPTGLHPVLFDVPTVLNLRFESVSLNTAPSLKFSGEVTALRGKNYVL